MSDNLTTPFGRRPLSLAMVASQVAARAYAESEKAAEAAVHKWRLFRSLTEARDRIGVGAPALAVLHALLSFHQETTLTLIGAEQGGAGLIVFPSNRELSVRAHGMPPSSLRRHLASLVETGLIIRRDSANGKRFARKRGGEIEDAFGFDLTPLIVRAAEIEAFAEEARTECRTVALLRERITILRRNILKMIEFADEEGAPGDQLVAYRDRFTELVAGYARGLGRVGLEPLAEGLAVLAGNLRSLLISLMKERNISANESQNERHIQNQITNHTELELGLQEGQVAPPKLTIVAEDGSITSPKDLSTENLVHGLAKGRTYPLGMVLSVCPNIVDYAKGGEITNWRDLARAAETVRSILGVSPSAWQAAIETMGETDASILIAALLQRGEEIKSAGGYVRALTEKARAGAFSIGPVLIALFKKTKGGRRASG